MLDGQLIIMSAHLLQREKVGEGFQKSFDRNSGFHERLGQHLILCGDFNESFYGLTDCHHVGESIPRPRTLTATNDTSTSITRRCGRNGPDGDERLWTQAQNRNCTHDAAGRNLERRADTNGLHHDLEETGSKTGASTGLRLVQDGSQGGACCFFR